MATPLRDKRVDDDGETATLRARGPSEMIYAMHGVIEPPSQQILTPDLMLNTREFDTYLSQRQPFVALEAALEGRGDALTIDDATRAAYDAALLARKHGHEVSLFVNSEIVRNSIPYYLHTLSNMIVKMPPTEALESQEHIIPRSILTNGRLVREHLKHCLSRLPDELARESLLRKIWGEIDISAVSLPFHLRTLSIEQLAHLADCGVKLENHGASHTHFSVFTDDEIQAQIRECQHWLLETFNIVSRYFAVPFGHVLPSYKLTDGLLRCWLLQTEALSAGFVGAKVYNRAELTISSNFLDAG